jgi:hypothetical protein
MNKPLKMKWLLFLLLAQPLAAQPRQTVDVCVYGGTSAGIIAAYTAKRMGKTVLLVEPSQHLGGLTTGGLGYTDIGNKFAITGLARDFYRRVGQHYGRLEQWIFEPSVAAAVFDQYLQAGQIEVRRGLELVTAQKNAQGYLTQLTLAGPTGQQVVAANMFLDCTYEGDLLARAGVSYAVGREVNATYGETYNGVQLLDKHQFPDGVDPYQTKGVPASGLLWGISPQPLAASGSGDQLVQAYNFRICLSSDPANQIPITEPDNFDVTRYELLLRYLEIKKPKRLNDRVLKIDSMPNRKTDINNNGPFSTDMIGENHAYPEADPATRAQIVKKHEDYIKGLLYFLANDLRVPKHLRTEMKKYGYPKDEYVGTGHWSPQIYVREARRMVGSYVMTQANCQGKTTVPDVVGLAAYTMDSHNCQRVVVRNAQGVAEVRNEGDVQVGGFPPYPIAYGSLVPKPAECKNLLVPVCLSASHIAYGSIRMEPVFMLLAQSAAVAACLAIDARVPVQQVDVKKIQNLLKTNPLMDGSTPELLVDDADAAQVQRQGEWKTEYGVRGQYGRSVLVANGLGAAPGWVRFGLPVARAGTYEAYAYFPRLPDGAKQVTVTLYDGQTRQPTILRLADLPVLGQTSGEWVRLGQYALPKGKKAYIEMSAQGADGKVLADAVLLVPKR